MANLPTVLTKSGLQPQAPADLRAQLVNGVAATNPGYTANLPGTLIEDITSTAIGAVALCDSARVELVNSLTPYGANEFILNQLGQQAGVAQGAASNTNVNVIFTGTAGFVIDRGFTVSDGNHQYVVQDGGILSGTGTTATSGLLFCVATDVGSWAVPVNSVNQLITSVPSTITLSVTNPNAGVPSASAQTAESYRADVLQAGKADAQGMTTFLKTMLRNVPGVQSRLVSMRMVAGGWEVIVGGGDPYQVANAIFKGLFDLPHLVPSTIHVTNITQANPGVVTTDLNHGYTTAQVINIAGVVGMTSVNNTPLTVTVLSPNSFSIGVNTSGYGAYVSGGVVTPNFRNQSVTIKDYPDVYLIPYVVPPQELVTISLVWNTNAINFVSDAAVAQYGAPKLVDYINSLPVGQPINEFEMQDVFRTAVAAVLPPQLLSRMVFTITINSVGVSPVAGTGIVNGDPESYFFTSLPAVTISRG